MFEQEQRKLLNDAANKFPEGCVCEDCGVCPYCRFIVTHLSGRNTNSDAGVRKLFCNVIYEKARFNIPIGEAEQIYELKRMFRRPVSGSKSVTTETRG
jgi:hypothetical protein